VIHETLLEVSQVMDYKLHRILNDRNCIYKMVHVSRMADTEDIPKDLLLKLMETSIKAAYDNDKVK
jgi:hypothetical protein